MAEDLARFTPTPYSPEFLAATHAALTEALRESRGEEGRYWHALGFTADYLRFGDKAGNHAFLRELTDRLGGNEQGVEFCRVPYYWRAMRGQPLGYGRENRAAVRGFLSDRGLPGLHDVCQVQSGGGIPFECRVSGISTEAAALSARCSCCSRGPRR